MDRPLAFVISLAVLLSNHLGLEGIHSNKEPLDSVVRLPYGSFQGFNSGNITQFLGIPFAQPPVKELRFREPRMPISFSGTRNATTYGSACPQITFTPIMGLNFEGNYTSISEDCLTINVFKPTASPLHSKLPVAVWFHGGGFEVGDASDTDVAPLVERSILLGKPIILVVPNYRVNAFGFLAGREVQKGGVGNLGLRDQIFALKWVQNHIAAFGGDADQVIISGISAGAISVGMHLISPEGSAPLFHGAFMESGAIPPLDDITQGQGEYDELTTKTNCSRDMDTLDCLCRVPFDDLVAAVNATRNLFSYSSLANAWKPRVDGDIVPGHPHALLARGELKRVPIVVGTCDDEGTLFSLANLNVTTNEEFTEYIHSNYFSGLPRSEILKLDQAYPADPGSGSPFGTGDLNALTPQFKRLAAIQGDIVFQAPRRALLKSASEIRNAWGFVYQREKTTPIFGSSHGSDMKEWFARNVQFINTLNPNLAESIFWPTYTWNSSTSHAGA
ncbi:alpha/beta-hydrolase, partial [Mycena filopes]